MSILTANLYPLTELSNRLPKRRGKRMHYATLYRWATLGCRGRRLTTYRIGGVLYTSDAAVEEFLTVHPTHDSKSAPSARRQAEIAKAEAELDAAGI